MVHTVTAANRNRAAFTSCSLLLVTMLFGASHVYAQPASQVERKPNAPSTRRIVVSIPDRKLALLENERIVKVYDVAAGAAASPSPTGEFQIVQRLENPGYYHPGVIVAPGKGNPLGTRWVGLNVKAYGIHGTNRPASVGKNASHGCIRLRNRDIEDLFARVKVGDRVSVVAERNEEVARLFGGTPDSPHSTEILTARNDSSPAPESDSRGDK